MTESYNGWTNWETWNCALWMDQDADYWLEELKNHRNVTSLAEAIKSSFEDMADEYYSCPGFLADLVNAGLREVNWTEIAEHFFNDDESENDDDA